MSARSPRGLQWLRSPWLQVLLLFGGALILAGIHGLQAYETSSEFAAARGIEISLWDMVERELPYWSVWAIAAWPLVKLAGWVTQHVRWTLLLIPLHIGLAWGVCEGVSALSTRISQAVLEAPERPRFGESGGGEELTGEAGAQEPGAREGRGPREWRASGRRGRPDRFERTRLTRSLLVYLMILMSGAAVRALIRAQDEQRRADLLDTELARAQLASLRAQLHPRFLFNALHSVGGLVREHEEQAALEALSSLAELLRTTLERGDEAALPLAEELEVVERYVELESLRLGERLAFELDVAPGTLDARVPALLLLPLVENAVKHAIAPRREGGRLAVRTRLEGSFVVVEVEDDGPGFPEAILHDDPPRAGERRGIGVANTRSRLRLLHGPEAKLELENLAPSGALARLVLPINGRGSAS